MEHIFCGINFPAPQKYQRVRVENVNLSESTASLKEKIINQFKIKDCEISLVYCGSVLEDDEPLNKNKTLRAGSTIQVLKKHKEESPKEWKKFTEIDVSRVVSYFRALNSGNFHKISRPEVINAIFKKHPELQKDIVALSFLRDPILLSNLQNPDTVRKMAEHHRILIEASEDICKALKSVKSSVPPAAAVQQPSFEHDFSDSSSSSGSEGASAPRASTSAGRRITSDLLRRSLAAATSNQNSLANISQRNLYQGISPSTSSSSITNNRRITSSMFMDAMNEVLRSSSSSRPQATPAFAGSHESSVEPEQPQPASEDVQMESEEAAAARVAAQDAQDVEMIASFQSQLKSMEEMGLTNKATNIQALMVTGGNLEAAVNLVLAEMNMS